MKRPLVLTIGSGPDRQTRELSLCPANFITYDHIYMLQLYHHYKDGFLPLPGGILSQPAIFVRSINIIKAEVGRIEEAEHERIRSQSK